MSIHLNFVGFPPTPALESYSEETLTQILEAAPYGACCQGELSYDEQGHYRLAIKLNSEQLCFEAEGWGHTPFEAFQGATVELSEQLTLWKNSRFDLAA